MNSAACVNLILKQIHENVRLFEKTCDLQKLVTVLFNLAAEVMQQQLSSSILRNIIIAVKELHEKNVIGHGDYKQFTRDVNKFYKSQSLCENYKLAIISCFAPAVELELLSLLKLCTNVSNTNDLNDIQFAVENSILVQACQKNISISQKVIKILQKAFIFTEGNPVICYLTFCLCKSIELSTSNPCLLSKELIYLNTLFQIPYHLVSAEDGELFVKYLIKLCFDSENLKLCSKKDIIFYTVISPICYRKMLDLCKQQTYILDFFTFLCNDNRPEILDCSKCLSIAQESHIWKYLKC